MWICMNFKYLNLSQHISGVFWHFLHVQCHIISHYMDIIVLHSAYVSWWMCWLLDKGLSRANTCLRCKEGYETFWGHVTAHLCENYVLLFCVVLCIEFVCGVLERRVTESEPTVGGMCYNNVVMWGFVSVNRCKDASLKRVTVHLTKDMALLDVGSSTLDWSVVCLPCKVLWCSTVLK